MKHKSLKSSLLISLLLSATILSGCSTIIGAFKSEPFEDEPGERSTGTRFDDEVIETKALVNLDKTDPQLAQAHISITSYNGVVLMTGQVPSEDMRQKAADVVSRVGGIKRVHNELTVSGNSSTLVRSNDSWISTKIKTKLLADSQIEGSRIKVVTENGVVYLMGLLTREEGDMAAEVARTTSGVQKVVRIFEYI